MTLRYDAASGAYSATIPPGTAALREFIRRRFAITRTEVIRDRDRCTHLPSEHCDCRAIDAFSAEKATRRRVFEWAVQNAERLGLQSVIADRRVWGFGVWHERAYNGPSDHTDHCHIGLTRAAAATLTLALIEGTEAVLDNADKRWLQDNVVGPIKGAIDYLIEKVEQPIARAEGARDEAQDAKIDAIAAGVRDLLDRE